MKIFYHRRKEIQIIVIILFGQTKESTMVTRIFSDNLYDYDDVMLVPQQCRVNSRKEIDVSTTFGKDRFKLPVVPANMASIIDKKLAAWLVDHGYFYIMHRFDVDPIEFTQSMHEEGLFSSVSFGVQKEDFDNVDKMTDLDNPIEYVTIDIAHGDTDRVYDLVKKIKNKSPETFVIAGNVGHSEAVKRLENVGADAIKVGISGGSACLTAPQTGFGNRGWMLTIIEECKKASTNSLIIADGGIRKNGDFAKAIAFGADMVMAGGIFAAHDMSPGETISRPDGIYKEYWGSASEHQKGERRNVEGRKLILPYRGKLTETLRDIEESLQSSVSYAGGKTLEALRNVEFVVLRGKTDL